MLETGDISRFATVGDYASYCRCVGSQKISNGKKKGKGNTKNGNKYLAWAYVEAANVAVRYNAKIRSFYQKKKANERSVGSGCLILESARELSQSSRHRAGRMVRHPLNGVAHRAET
jgi:transposase